MSAKIRFPERSQVQMRAESLDQLLPPEHPARGVWAFVETLDLTPWTNRIASRIGESGAPALDPRVLASLWLLATLDGVGSARAVSRLCEFHIAYRWLCGDEPINYHSLSDFRASDPAWLEALLAQSAAALMHAGVADLNRVAQDGVRVRASAGASSLRRGATLKQCLAEAEAQVRALKGEGDDDGGDGEGRSRSEAAKDRAARERKERIEAALAALEELKARNAKQDKARRKDESQLRASTTDPDARKMKMADGGFRPALNVQFATTVKGGVIVGVDVSNRGSDAAELEPMLKKLEAAYKRRPGTVLVDGGFANVESIDAAESKGTRVLAPVPRAEEEAAKGKDPYARREGDTDGVAEWRARMATEEAKAEYKDRASTAEWANAQARNRGLRQFLVRGLAKAKSVCLWFALAHNLARKPRFQMAAG
jgi:transposase